VAALPNPPGADSEFEEIHLRNTGASPLALSGCRITNGLGQQNWLLSDQDAVVAPRQVLIVVRRGRPMPLRNGETRSFS
jgi:hypothetical protein